MIAKQSGDAEHAVTVLDVIQAARTRHTKETLVTTLINQPQSPRATLADAMQEFLSKNEECRALLFIAARAAIHSDVLQSDDSNDAVQSNDSIDAVKRSLCYLQTNSRKTSEIMTLSSILGIGL